MYIVRFNTKKFRPKKAGKKDWEAVLMNDFAKAINGKIFRCKSESDLLDRLSFIAGSTRNWTYYDDAQNYLILDSPKYGRQSLKFGMYGIPQGYVNLEKIAISAQKKLVRIPFYSFYDGRQRNFFSNCFVEVYKESVLIKMLSKFCKEAV